MVLRRSSVRCYASLCFAAAVLVSCSSGESTDSVPAAAPTSEVASSTSASPTTETATTDAPTTTTTEAPAPDLELLGLGEYAVGVTTVTVAQDTERPLTVDIWFPIDEAGERPAHEYTFLPGIFYRSPNAVTATLDDVAPSGPFPLVLYSHGSGGQRYIHSNYTETLASHGYVVVAADHTGNTLVESFINANTDLATSALVRPADVGAVLDAVLGSNGPSALSTAFDVVLTDDPVVITGHSLGGYTSYASVGGIETDEVSIVADDRIGAIITLAPFAAEAVLPEETLLQIDVPQLIIVGTDDKTTPIDPNVERPWDLAPGSPAYRMELEAAEHLTFTDMCDYVTFLPELGTVPEFIVTELETRSAEGCSVGDMPIDRAQALTNTFAVRFLDSIIDGEPFIDPDTETLPDDVAFDER